MSCPAHCEAGPTWPYPLVEQYTTPGLRSDTAAYPMPSRSTTPGRKLSTTTSAAPARARKASRPSESFRSISTRRMPRCPEYAKYEGTIGAASAAGTGPTLTTSAP